MKYLVDANVLSEGTKPQPSRQVLSWLRDHEEAIVVDPIILGEIRFGILLLAPGKRQRTLERWFDGGVRKIVCLPWETRTAMHWAGLLAKLRREGLTMPIKDSMIAATALAHSLTVATRNGQDFKKAGVPIVDPFEN